VTLLMMAVLLALSGLVSASETALFSLGPAERRRLAARHPTVSLLMERPTALLLTLLLLNLVVNIAYLSVSAKQSLELHASGRDALSAAVAAGSLLALVLLGEILPKTLALAAPQALVGWVAPPLAFLRMALWPLVFVGETITRLIEAPLLFGRSQPGSPGAGDFKSAVSVRASRGAFRAVEVALLHDIIDFGELRARDLMVPRVDVAFLDVRDDLRRWAETMAERPHADYPVCEGSPDHLLGTVCAAEVLTRQPADLRDLLEPACFAPLPITAERLVTRLDQEGRRMAILLDEHGGVAGVVGLRALSQSVLGELGTLPVGGRAGPVTRRRDTLIVDGRCPLHVLREEGGVQLAARGSRTVGGVVAEGLGRLPRPGDELLVGGWRLRVASVTGRRIGRLVIRPSTRSAP
jgi:CBS domain containing-hemolysin-like protein